MDRYLGIVLAQRWSPMNNISSSNSTNRRNFKEPFEADLNRLNDVLRNGCPDCILRHCNEQDQLPVIDNEAIENLDNL